MPTINLANMTQEQISNFCGVLNRNVKAIEQHFGLSLRFKDDRLELVSPDTVAQTVIDTVDHILEQSRNSALPLQEVEKILNVADKHSLVHHPAVRTAMPLPRAYRKKSH
jgi:phosphate starvation-inducible protein PhoH